MGYTNEFERDLEDQASLKRPGRVDLRLFQNTADAGDGHPGLQRCFRNYLHEGGMEKDLELVGYGIKGTSVDINNVELQQLSNIGSVTINGTQWGYVGGADQPVKQGDSPTFVGLTLSANLVTSSTVDGVNVGDLKTSYDAHLHDANTLQFDGVNSDGGAFSFNTTGIVTFNQDTTVPNLITAGNVDGVDVSAHNHSGAGQGGTVNHANLLNVLTSQHHVKYTDAEALAASYVGEGSTDVVWSNDPESYGDYMGIWAKLKEIAVYDSIKCDVYWEYKTINGVSVQTRLKKNGSFVGTEHSTTSTSFVPITESDLTFVRGDTLELWGKKSVSPNNLVAQYLRIKFLLYDNTLVTNPGG